jgi:hypothetical protein
MKDARSRQCGVTLSLFSVIATQIRLDSIIVSTGFRAIKGICSDAKDECSPEVAHFSAANAFVIVEGG